MLHFLALALALAALTHEPPPSPVVVKIDDTHPGLTWWKNRGHKRH